MLNGAAVFQGKSLNRALLTGPDFLQNLIRILIQFREYRVAVSADIEVMFLQVGVPSSDQDVLRFLWREDPTAEVGIFRYTRHIFSAKDSPTCANYALRRTATDNTEHYPEASKAVVSKFYMDDYLDSRPTVSETMGVGQSLTEPSSFSSFKRLQRDFLDPTELQTAKGKLFLLSQRESIPEEFNSLCSGSHVAKRSKLAPFAPFAGPGGLLRS